MTKTKLKQLKEKQLREDILIPLFRAMGFRDVFEYHGGSLEKGKDIIMWKPNESGNRINYAVIVKTTNISGKVTGKSSAGEVRIQIEQCFNEPCKDPVTGKKIDVDRCWIVTSKKITKEALEAIGGILESQNLTERIEFINGDKLYEYLEKHAPEKTVFDKLNQIQQLFDNASPHYQIVTQMEDNNIGISLKPKYPGAETEHPLRFSNHLYFPDTPEGKEKSEEYERYIRTGAPFMVPKEFIQNMEIPDFLKPFLEGIEGKIRSVGIGPQRIMRSFWVQIGVNCIDGQKFTMDTIELRIVQAGTEEITLTNEHQTIPWKLRLVFNSRDKKMHFWYNVTYAGLNVNQVLELLKFQSAMAKGGEFIIKDVMTGFPLYQTMKEENKDESPSPKFIELIEKLVFIQKETKTYLTFPGAEIEPLEIIKILTTAEKIETGRQIFTGSDFTFNIDKKGLAIFIDDEKRENISFTGDIDGSETIFGTVIPLGPVRVSCNNLCIPDEDLHALKAKLRSMTDDEIIPVPLKLCDDAQITAEYLKWKPKILPIIP